MSLLKNLPVEIIYHHILPYIPCYGISKNMLKLQKKRIVLAKYLEELFLMDDDRILIKRHILSCFDGNSDCYTYENNETFLYLNLRNRNDFIYLMN